MEGKWNVKIEELDRELLKVIEGGQCITLGELSNKLSSKLGLPDYLIAYRVWVLWKRGLINLGGFGRGDSIINYLLSSEALWFWISIAITYVALALIYISNPVVTYIRYFVGTAFITFILGYSVVEFIYPKGNEVSPIERFVLSLGLSLVVIPIIGVLLAYMPFRYTVISMPITMTLFTTIMLTLAMIKKARYVMGIAAWC
jgi:hypothetical protein